MTQGSMTHQIFYIFYMGDFSGPEDMSGKMMHRGTEWWTELSLY